MSLFISVVIHSPGTNPNFYSDIMGSVWTRGWVQSGALPYLTESFEYPVISGLIVYFVRAVGHDITTFYSAFSALGLATGSVVAWSCWSITKKLGRNLDPIYFVMPSFILYGIFNFDLFHVMFVVLSIQSYIGGRKGLSAGFLGLGSNTRMTGRGTVQPMTDP